MSTTWAPQLCLLAFFIDPMVERNLFSASLLSCWKSLGQSAFLCVQAARYLSLLAIFHLSVYVCLCANERVLDEKR